MAPTAPKKRTTMRTKLAKAQTSSTSAARPPPLTTSSSSGPLFPDTKRDRRLIKKSAFLGQIRSKSGTSSGGVTKRRRPSKKLVADLDSLAAALPALEDGGGGAPQQPGKVRMKSIRHRPGALKRKEKLVRAETQNIGRSLAFLSSLDGKAEGACAEAGVGGGGAAAGTAPPAPAPTANRWAALRAHISETMEQNPAFLAKEQ